jgi:ABC-type multidrug transport system ATPase subunit
MLVVRDVDKRLGGRAILASVSFACAAGEACVITGDNGSGKSTLLRIAVGLVEADRGAITVGGLSVNGASGQARRLLGYVPDATDVLPELSVGELVALVQTFKRAGGTPIDALRARLGLDDLWRQRLATLSFGQRKRALLLAALVGAPPLLVLDEPTNGLDGPGLALITELVEHRCRQGEATVLATNDLHFAGRLNASRFNLAGGRLARLGRADSEPSRDASGGQRDPRA